MTWKLTRAQTVGVVAFAVLIVVPPLPSRVSTPFILEPGSQADVRAAVSGMIAKVLVHQGDEVRQGQTLAVMENPSLASDVSIDARQRELAEERLRLAEATGDAPTAAAARRETERLAQNLEVANEKYGQLEIRAPLAGIITTPELPETVGEHLRDGQLFCHISSRKRMQARILVRDWRLGDVQTGAQVSFKVSPYPFRTYSGHVERILPAAALDRPIDAKALEQNGQETSNYMALVAELANSDGSLREGMTGTAKIYRGLSPIAWQAGRGMWRWLKSQVW